MGPKDLAQVLRPLTMRDHPDLLIGLKTSDDAAVYRIDDSRAVIQTIDFFPPIVDDPYTFGAIAAANAVSDVFAMGGKVLLALNVATFPSSVPNEILSEIFRGGADKVQEAGGIVAGGHTVIDPEPKYGLCVTGIVETSNVVTKSGARPGDALVLTKPLGTGVITTAVKMERASPGEGEVAIESMLKLNRTPSEIMQQVGVNACTDITGFALLGHAAEIAEKSGVSIVIFAEDVPLLTGAELHASEGLATGAVSRNKAHLMPEDGEQVVSFAPKAPEHIRNLLLDAETSGGLLISLPRENLDAFEEAIVRAGENYWVIGRVEEGRGVSMK